MGKYLISIKFGYHDSWSSNTGYNLANKFIGEFKGTFPKFTLKFGELKPEDIQYLTKKIFRKPVQTCVYNDPELGVRTIKVHKGDVGQEWLGVNKSKGFSFEIVGNEAL